MRITSITPYNLQAIHNNKEINKQNFNTLPQVSGNLPTTMQYLAFTGGYSINLAKTIERLDILAQKKSKESVQLKPLVLLGLSTLAQVAQVIFFNKV